MLTSLLTWWDAFYAFMGGTPWMAVAFVTNIGAVALLAANRRLIGWVLGIIGPVTLAVVVLDGGFYADFVLNVYYVITGVYGLHLWTVRTRDDLPGEDASGEEPLPGSPDERPISATPRAAWPIMAAVVAALTLGFGWWFTRLGSDIAYLDSFTTAISVVAQYALARKWMGTWGLWVLADVIDIPLYWSKGLGGVALLTAVYLVLCLYGIRTWAVDWTEQGDAPRSVRLLAGGWAARAPQPGATA